MVDARDCPQERWPDHPRKAPATPLTGRGSRRTCGMVVGLLFYAGVLGIFPDGTRAGLYSGLYMIMALIFAMARRVLPFFIEKGVDGPVNLKNRAWLDMGSLVLLIVFWIADVLDPDSLPVAILAAALCLLHATRLAG